MDNNRTRNMNKMKIIEGHKVIVMCILANVLLIFVVFVLYKIVNLTQNETEYDSAPN